MVLTRRHRADLVRQAARIRTAHQRHGAPVHVIADDLQQRLPGLSPLEAWRLAYGWTRPRVVEEVIRLYQDDGLMEPGLSTAMLCRWEHGGAHPSPEYAHALTRLYGAPAWRLGLNLPAAPTPDWYGRRNADPTQRQGIMEHSSLRAVTDSVDLQLHDDGPAGGPGTHNVLTQALTFYTDRYGDYPPGVLATEIHRCRTLVVDVLGNNPRDRAELRRIAGWLSALLGNLAFHTGDTTGAHIHLSTSARLGTEVGDHGLAGWSLGAQSMVALADARTLDAVDLAEQAAVYADTPLRRAQIAAWARLRPLARLGRHDEADRTAAQALDAMAAAGSGDPGRFGFDEAELELHLAEAHLDLDRPVTAATHARTSIDSKAAGSGGWAAATAVLARTHAARHEADDACALADAVLDTVPADALRSTTRRRLEQLLSDLNAGRAPGRRVRRLHDRVMALPRPSTPMN